MAGGTSPESSVAPHGLGTATLEDEADLVHLGGFSGAAGLEHGKALAIGVRVKAISGGSIDAAELAGRPELRFVGMEGVAGSGVGGNHNLVVRRDIKKLFAVAGPLRGFAPTSGNLPLAARAGERSHINFVISGFVRLVSEPATIRREDGRHFAERAVQEGLWLSGFPAGLFIAFDRQRQDVPRDGIELKKCQDLAIGT